MPALPSWAQAWLQARESADAALLLVTITHPEWGTRRLVRNTEDVSSRGETFLKSYFEIEIVPDNDRPATVSFSMPNVDREVGLELINLTSPPEVALEIMSSAYLDGEPIYRAARLELRNIKITAIDVSGDLYTRDYSSEPLGTIVMTPARAPGLFQVRQ